MPLDSGGIGQRDLTTRCLLSAGERAQLVELYESGKTITEISKEMYLSRSSVHAYLKRDGVKMRPQGQHKGQQGRHFPGHKAMDRTVALYQSGLSSNEVGEILGITHSTVCYRLALAGVPTRSRSEALRIRLGKGTKT
jgi:DNA-binding CsgD family transcriptional regulator